jgi:acetylxylan esterase
MPPAIDSAWARRLAVVAAAAALAVVGIDAGTAGAVAAPTSPCATVHVIAARGSTEQPGAGVIGSLVTDIQNGVSATVSTQAVVYPALLFPYDTSSTAGDTAVEQELTAEVQQCPSQKIVLVGYSQGAQIIGDALGGGGGVSGLGPASAPVSSAIASHVVAVIQFGDPRHLPNLSFDKGTAVNVTGLFPRLASQSLSAFASSIQSYCDTGDPFCASGNNLGAHLDYTTKYDTAATTFVVGRLHSVGVN